MCSCGNTNYYKAPKCAKCDASRPEESDTEGKKKSEKKSEPPKHAIRTVVSGSADDGFKVAVIVSVPGGKAEGTIMSTLGVSQKLEEGATTFVIESFFGKKEVTFVFSGDVNCVETVVLKGKKKTVAKAPVGLVKRGQPFQNLFRLIIWYGAGDEARKRMAEEIEREE